MTNPRSKANPANSAKQAPELARSADLAEGAAPPARGPDGRFLTGNSGGGRPKGSRNRLTDVFLSAIADDFASHGVATIARIREEDPIAYVRIVGALVPRELVLERERDPPFDLDRLTWSDVIVLIEEAERRHSIRMALTDAERIRK